MSVSWQLLFGPLMGRLCPHLMVSPLAGQFYQMLAANFHLLSVSAIFSLQLIILGLGHFCTVSPCCFSVLSVDQIYLNDYCRATAIFYELYTGAIFTASGWIRVPLPRPPTIPKSSVYLWGGGAVRNNGHLLSKNLPSQMCKCVENIKISMIEEAPPAWNFLKCKFCVYLRNEHARHSFPT